jgi:hypothetical protein
LQETRTPAPFSKQYSGFVKPVWPVIEAEKLPQTLFVIITVAATDKGGGSTLMHRVMAVSEQES